MIPVLLATTVLTLPPNTKLFQYGIDRMEVTCAPGNTCSVMLLSDSGIQDLPAPNNSKANPQTGWMIRTGFAGGHPMIYLSPLGVGPPSNMVITTNEQRRYTVTLLAVPMNDQSDYAIAAPDDNGEIHIASAPIPKLVIESPTPIQTPADLPPPSGAPPRMTGDPSLAPATATRTSDSLDLTYRVPNGDTPPSVSRMLDNGTLATINYTTTVAVQPNGEIVTYRIFDLSHTIVITRGTGHAQRRLEIIP